MWLTQAQDIFTFYSTTYYTSVLKTAVANKWLNGTSFVRDIKCQYTKQVNSTSPYLYPYCVYNRTLANYSNSEFDGSFFFKINIERVVRSLMVVTLKSCDNGVVCV